MELPGGRDVISALTAAILAFKVAADRATKKGKLVLPAELREQWEQVVAVAEMVVAWKRMHGDPSIVITRLKSLEKKLRSVLLKHGKLTTEVREMRANLRLARARLDELAANPLEGPPSDRRPSGSTRKRRASSR